MRAFRAPKLESAVERPACKKAKALGWGVMKVVPLMGNPTSRPDRLFWREGLYVWIEFKRPGDEPTEAQHREHERLRANGCLVFWTDDEAEALRILAECWAAHMAQRRTLAAILSREAADL